MESVSEPRIRIRSRPTRRGLSYDRVGGRPTTSLWIGAYNRVMTFEASLVVIALVIVVIGGVLFARLHVPRRKTRKRRAEEPLDALSDPPTITHYGHG